MRALVRAQHSLRAIVASHAAGSRGSVPCMSARCAERNVCCAASSASARSRRSARQRPWTVRPYSAKSCSVRAAAAPLPERPCAWGAECGSLAVSNSAVMVAAVVVPLVVIALIVVAFPGDRQLNRHGLPDERGGQREAAWKGNGQALTFDGERHGSCSDRSDGCLHRDRSVRDLTDIVLVLLVELTVRNTDLRRDDGAGRRRRRVRRMEREQMTVARDEHGPADVTKNDPAQMRPGCTPDDSSVAGADRDARTDGGAAADGADAPRRGCDEH